MPPSFVFIDVIPFSSNDGVLGSMGIFMIKNVISLELEISTHKTLIKKVVLGKVVGVELCRSGCGSISSA